MRTFRTTSAGCCEHGAYAPERSAEISAARECRTTRFSLCCMVPGVARSSPSMHASMTGGYVTLTTVSFASTYPRRMAHPSFGGFSDTRCSSPGQRVKERSCTSATLIFGRSASTPRQKRWWLGCYDRRPRGQRRRCTLYSTPGRPTGITERGALRRQRVAVLDGVADGRAALRGREVGVLLDGGGLVGQALVFDTGAEPAGVVAAPQVVQPRGVVHALGELQEDDQVLGAQVQLPLGAAEVEALLCQQLSLRILAPVAAALRARRLDAHLHGRRLHLGLPDQDLPRRQRVGPRRWRREAARPRKVAQCGGRRGAHRQHHVHLGQHRGREVARL